MFNNNNKCKGQIILTYKNGQEESKPLNRVKYLNNKIIDKSMEIFSDPEPCIIRRTHAVMALCMELMEKIDNNNYQDITVKDNLDSFIFQYIDPDDLIKKQVESITII